MKFDILRFAETFSFCDTHELSLICKACKEALEWAESVTPETNTPQWNN